MDAYLPRDPLTLVRLAGALLVVLGAGLELVARERPPAPRSATWGLVFLALGAATHLTAAEPPGLRMLALCALVLVALKAVVAGEARRLDGTRLDPTSYLAFALLWPGMDPAPFARLGKVHGMGPTRWDWEAGRELLGWGVFLGGTGFLFLGLAQQNWRDGGGDLWTLGFALLGYSLCVHFGLFHTLTGLWRARGVAVQPCFETPLLATSLHEFWGKRWNRPFTQLVRLAVYRPLGRTHGPGPALAAGFLLSALLHEMAITLPVHAGYGGPLAYFLLHGSLVAFERGLHRRGRGIHRVPALGHAWTLTWLLLPVPLLFPTPFLEQVVLPIVAW